MERRKLLLTAMTLAGALALGHPAYAQSSDTTQAPGTTKSTSAKMNADTTGTVAKSGDHPKQGVEPNCKEILANQAGHNADEIKACGDKSE
jgi:hypothetical protein